MLLCGFSRWTSFVSHCVHAAAAAAIVEHTSITSFTIAHTQASMDDTQKVTLSVIAPNRTESLHNSARYTSNDLQCFTDLVRNFSYAINKSVPKAM